MEASETVLPDGTCMDKTMPEARSYQATERCVRRFNAVCKALHPPDEGRVLLVEENFSIKIRSSCSDRPGPIGGAGQPLTQSEAVWCGWEERERDLCELLARS